MRKMGTPLGTVTFRKECDAGASEGVEEFQTPEKGRKRDFTGLYVAIGYAVVSVAITLSNKIVMTTYSFKEADVLILLQMAFTIAFLVVAREIGLISIPEFSWSKAHRVFPLSILFVGMATSGLVALGMNNVPMYSALRKQTTLIVLIQERAFLSMEHTLLVKFAVITMSIGAAIAGWNDLHGTSLAYAIALLACVFTAAYNVLVKKISAPSSDTQNTTPSERTGLTSYELLLYNNMWSFPVMLLWCGWSGSLESAGRRIFASLVGGFDEPVPIGLCLSLTASVTLAPLLNYAIFTCTQVNSPLTTSVTGDLKNLGTDVVGLFAFSDVIITPLYLAGIALATLGGIFYSIVKLFKL